MYQTKNRKLRREILKDLNKIESLTSNYEIKKLCQSARLKVAIILNSEV